MSIFFVAGGAVLRAVLNFSLVLVLSVRHLPVTNPKSGFEYSEQMAHN